LSDLGEDVCTLRKEGVDVDRYLVASRRILLWALVNCVPFYEFI